MRSLKVAPTCHQYFTSDYDRRSMTLVSERELDAVAGVKVNQNATNMCQKLLSRHRQTDRHGPDRFVYPKFRTYKMTADNNF